MRTVRIDISPEDLDVIRAQAVKADPTTDKHRRPETVITSGSPSKKVLGGDNFRELLQNIYDAVLITRFDGRIESVNKRAERFFANTKEQLCTQSITQLVSGSEGVLLPTITKNLEAGRYTLVQAHCLRADGSSFPAEISANRIRISDEDYLSFLIRDTTLRKEAEERLLTGYSALYNAGSGVAISDPNGKLTYCNPALMQLLGIASMEEAAGASVGEFLSDPSIVDELRTAVAKGESRQGEVEMCGRQGERFFAQLSAVPNYNTDREISGIVFSLLDVTKEKEVQQQLKQSAEELERYAGELSAANDDLQHDLDLARDIQQAFILSTYPTFPEGCTPETSRMRFSHLYIPSGAVGGDFFDIWRISDTKAGIFFADVAGHGLRAALVVATLRGLLGQLTVVADDPSAFVTRMNSLFGSIFSKLDELMFVTAVYCVIDTEKGTLQFTNAGHPPPLRIRRDVGVVDYLKLEKGVHGPGIGLHEEFSFSQGEIPIAPGDVILLFTDGIYEVFDNERNSYSLEMLEQATRRHSSLPADALPHAILQEVKDFSGSEEFEDDVCLLTIEISDAD